MAFQHVAGLDNRHDHRFEHIQVVGETSRPHDRPRRQRTYHGDRRPDDRGRRWEDRAWILSSEGRQSSAPAGSGRFPGRHEGAAYFITTHRADPLRVEPKVPFGNDYASPMTTAPFRHHQLPEQLYPLNPPVSHVEESVWDRSPSPRSYHSASPPFGQPFGQDHGAPLRVFSQTSSPEPWDSKSFSDRGRSPGHGVTDPQFFQATATDPRFFPTRAPGTITDDDAVEQVRANVRRKRPRELKQHNYMLKGLIHSQSYSRFNVEDPLDQATLISIFTAVNSIFFDDMLSERVTWEWSDPSIPSEYDSRIVGRTSLTEDVENGGYRSSIVLSSKILSDSRYNRHLLVSAFIHELIHCYLFTVCGRAALEHGGHTNGFREIATIIDKWAGPDTLHLSHMEADLKNFLDPQTQQHSFCQPPQVADPQQHHHVEHHHHQQPPMILNHQQHQQFPMSRNPRWDHPDLLQDQAGHTFTNVLMTRSASDRGVAPLRSADIQRYGEERDRAMLWP